MRALPRPGSVADPNPFALEEPRLSSPAQIEYPEKIDGAVLKIAGVVVLGAIMSILDITVVNVALPDLQVTFTGR